MGQTCGCCLKERARRQEAQGLCGNPGRVPPGSRSSWTGDPSLGWEDCWWPEWGVRVQRGHPYCAPSAWCLTCSWEPFLPSSKPAAGRGLSTLAGRSRGADRVSPAVRAVGHRALPQGQAPAPPPVLQAKAAHSVAAACAGPVPGTFWRCLPWHRGLEPGGVSSCHWRSPRPLHRVFLVAPWGLSLGTGQVLVAVRAVGVADRGAPGAGLRPSGWGTRVGSVPTGLSMAPF